MRSPHQESSTQSANPECQLPYSSKVAYLPTDHILVRGVPTNPNQRVTLLMCTRPNLRRVKLSHDIHLPACLPACLPAYLVTYLPNLPTYQKIYYGFISLLLTIPHSSLQVMSICYPT